MEFGNHLALVTGGASGIGAACARLVVARGGRVVVADRNVALAQRVAGEIGVGASAVAIDVADEASVRAARDEIRARVGTVTVMINCAGVLQRTLPPDQLTMKEFDFVQQVDFRGTYLCCAVFGGDFAERGAGAIVNIASVAGMRSGPLHSYGPAKAAVIHLTECLAAEWGPRGVRVNTVSPGFTMTPALDRGIETRTLDAGVMSRASAFGRLVEPAEVAAAACFLVSDMASGITGVNVPVDAGYLVATPWASYGGLRAPR